MTSFLFIRVRTSNACLAEATSNRVTSNVLLRAPEALDARLPPRAAKLERVAETRLMLLNIARSISRPLRTQKIIAFESLEV